MIRPFGARDLFLLRNLQRRRVTLDPKSVLLWDRSPLQSAVIAWLLHDRIGTFTYILDSAGPQRRHGFVQVWARPGLPEWDVLYLAPSLDEGEEVPDIWYRLLVNLIHRAGERGVQRLYARLHENHRAEEIFGRVGFNVYSKEVIYRLGAGQRLARGTGTKGWRPLRPSEAWGLQCLYARATPHLVRQAEGNHLEEYSGSLMERFRLFGEEGHVLENEGRIVAYLGLTSGARGYWIRTLLDPDAGATYADVVAHGLCLLPRRAKFPVYWAVREYEEGLNTALEEAGFRPLTGYSLLVKHTVVRIQQRVPKLVPGFEKRIGATPHITTSNSTPLTKMSEEIGTRL